jgi:hypothetical protein
MEESKIGSLYGFLYWVKIQTKLEAQMLHNCIVFSLSEKPINSENPMSQLCIAHIKLDTMMG